jgi:hypothetical protein
MHYNIKIDLHGNVAQLVARCKKFDHFVALAITTSWAHAPSRCMFKATTSVVVDSGGD